MPEIGTSGSTSGDGKRSVAAWPKRPRPSSTLPNTKSCDARSSPEPAPAATARRRRACASVARLRSHPTAPASAFGTLCFHGLKLSGRVETPAASQRASEAKFDPRICSIWPPSGHLFMFTRGVSLVDVRPRRAPNGGSNMAFRKTRDAAEHDQPAETEVEAEIREFLRRDVVTNRERHPENESEIVANSINSVLQRATTTSVQEIDKLITELQTLRHMLHSKSAQVQREIVQYSTLTTAALHSTKIIAESLTQLKKAPDAPTLPDLKDRSVAS